jgi:hypothetical protein
VVVLATQRVRGASNTELATGVCVHPAAVQVRDGAGSRIQAVPANGTRSGVYSRVGVYTSVPWWTGNPAVQGSKALLFLTSETLSAPCSGNAVLRADP